MSVYVALLRGINVGGKSIIKMTDLKAGLESMGLTNVTTFIQSGNVVFNSDDPDIDSLASKIQAIITDTFSLKVPVLVLTMEQYQNIIKSVPKGWGNDPLWKYNILFLIPPYEMQAVIAGVGELKPDIETLTPGDGVLYQSLSKEVIGRTTTGKLASNPVYLQMTVRNHRTAKKLLTLMESLKSQL